jgi:hypothetical protein
MSIPLPGERLHRWLSSHVDSVTMRELIDPTVADLQHEVALAGASLSRRLLAIGRGYASLGRLLLGYGLRWNGVLRRWAVVLGLSVFGGFLMNASRQQHLDGRIVSSAFLLPMFLTPVVLRLSGAADSSRRLMTAAVAAGMLMWIFTEHSISSPGVGLARTTVRLSALLVMVSAFASIGVAMVHEPRTLKAAVLRRGVLAMAGGALTTTITFIIAVVLPRGEFPVQFVAAMAPFYVALFAALLLPAGAIVAAAAWRGVRQPAALAAIGALSFPLGVLASTLVDGSPSEIWAHLLTEPTMVFWRALPFVLGGLVLGWAQGQEQVPKVPVVPRVP